MLGLTATPDRADNGDIYKLCDYNIAYECDFRVGINNDWLVPFEYYGIYDDTDYSLIPWRSGKYDLEALENALVIEKRLDLVFKKYMEHRKKSTVGFCASIKHCEVMNQYFRKQGVKSEIIIGETPISKRQEIIGKFKEREIEVIFTVDIFNEGVDIPCIDTLLFLRPTLSYTIFIQQLGRGLRTFEGKDSVRVLDFVGNYKGAELRPLFLTGNYKKGKGVINTTDKEFLLPEGCSAEFNFKLIEYFEKFKRKSIRQEELVKLDYKNLMETLERVPTLMDTYTFGEIPVHMYIKTFKGWYNFQKEMGVLSEEQKSYSQKGIDFLYFLETTSMTKSYKMPLFLALFENLEKSQSLERIGEYFKKFYQSKEHWRDLNNKKHEDWESWSKEKFQKLAEDNPIKYLTEKGKNVEFFTYENKIFTLNDELYNEIVKNEKILEEIRERIEYRIVNYFSRKYMEV